MSCGTQLQDLGEGGKAWLIDMVLLLLLLLLLLSKSCPPSPASSPG